MKNNHDCISKVGEVIKKKNKDITWIGFTLADIKRKGGSGVAMTGQYFEYGKNHKKKNGEVVEQHMKSFVTHIYCPFCGQKYL